MELDSRKKSTRDRMMRSKSFETEGEKDKPEGNRRVERLSHLMDGNNRKCLTDGRNAKTKKGWKCVEENPCRARKVL